MIILMQCFILCTLFTIAILPAQYRNPLSQFASYPTAVKKRVYELSQYREFIGRVEQKNWARKVLGAFLIAAVMAAVAYFSGSKTFSAAFFHVFILFLSVNLYDLIVLDLMIFCHSKKLMIPGTEDMKGAYKDPTHHIIGAIKGCVIGAVVSFVSALFILLIEVFIK